MRQDIALGYRRGAAKWSSKAGGSVSVIPALLCCITKRDLFAAGKEAYVNACSEHMKRRLSDDYYCWVADDDGQIVAHVHIIITRKLPKPRNLNAVWGRLSTVRTIPVYRNRGVGSALMNMVKTWCYEQRLEELVVWPSERSVPFYERAGFKGENDVMEMLFE